MVGRPRSSVVSNSGRRGGGKTSARVSTASSAASRLSFLRDGENTPSVDSTFDWEEAKEKAIQSHRKKFQEVQNAALRDKKAKSERTRLMDPPPPPTNRTTRPSIPGVSDSSFDMSNAEREAIARNRQLFKEGQEKKRDRKIQLQQRQRSRSPSPGGDEEDDTEGEVSSTASNSPGRNRNTGKDTRDRQAGTDEVNGADMFAQLKRVLPRKRLPEGLKVIPQPPGKKRQAEQTSSATTKKPKTSQNEKQPEDSPQQIESDEDQAEAVPVVQTETMVTSTPCVEGLSQPRSTLSFTPSPVANRTVRKILLTGKPAEKTTKRTSSPSPGGDEEDDNDGEVSSTASNSPGRNRNTGKDTHERQAGTDEGNGADMLPQLKRVLRKRLPEGLKVIPQPPGKKRQAEHTSSATTKKPKTSQNEKQPEDSPQQIESDENQAEAVPVVQTETMVTSIPCVEEPYQPPPATAGTSQSFRKSRSVVPARSTMESDENENERDAAPSQPTRSANASQVASKSLSQQSIFSVVGPPKPRPRKRPSFFDTIRSNAVGETLKKPARASVVKRYVGKDKFGNYHMLKPTQFKTILDTAVPDHELNDLQRKKLELRVNHYLEDFFVNLCETTPQPRGFFSFHFLKELMINQQLLDEDATDFDLMKLMKSLCSPDAWKRGEGVLYPKRGKTENDDYLYTD